MIDNTVAKGLDYGVIGVLGFGAVLCAFGLLSALCLPNCKQRRQLEFFGSWTVRASLCLLSLFWLASQVLRMTHIWAQTTLLTEELAGSVGLLCRLYMSLALGLFQPWALWLALLLCRNTTIHEPRPRRWYWPCVRFRPPSAAGQVSEPLVQNGRVGKGDMLQGIIEVEDEATPAAHVAGQSKRAPADGLGNGMRLLGLAFMATLPFLALQTVIAWLSYILQDKVDWDRNPSSPGHYFFSPFDIGTGAQCPVELSEQGCVMCVFPAASTIALLLFAGLYCWLLVSASRAVKGYIINRKLRRRLNMLQVCVVFSMGLQVAMAGVTVVSQPWNVVFEVCWVVFAFATTALAIAIVWILAVFPLWSLLMAHKSGEHELPVTKLALYKPTELEMQLWPKDGSASSSPT